jgi:type II secretory pathway pseudopilin PulG
MLHPHEHVLDYVDAYLHGALARRETALVREHCAACRICAVALEEAERRQRALALAPRVEASEALIQHTCERIGRHSGRPEKSIARFFWYGAAAAALLIGVFHIYYANLRPSPYNLVVFGQSTLLPGAEASLRVRLANHRTGDAAQGIPVDVSLVDPKLDRSIQLTHFETDADGSASPRFDLPDWNDGDYELWVRARLGERDELLTRTVSLRRSWRLMLSTDKPVYQPGQVIRIRSLALRRPDLKPVAGQTIEYSISDPKGNIIFRRKDVTSRFGIASTDCPLATEIIEGAYQVQCQVGDTQSKATVEVKQYVLPKFKVEATLDRAYYAPGQRLRGTVEANYFFGKPVAGAAVEIVSENTPLLKTVEVLTDDEGKAEFEMLLPDELIGRESDSGDARVVLLTKVRDSAGQEQQSRVSRVVTARPLRIEVIPESGQLVRGIVNRVYLFTSYADGQPAATRVAVSGREQELNTNRLGVATLELKPGEESVELTLRAIDSDGLIGRRTVRLETGGGKNDFLVRTDKAVYDGGDTVRLVALGSSDEPVFLDFIKDGQTVLTETVNVRSGRGNAMFDLPPELFGTVELCAYRFDAAGHPVRKSRAIHIRPAQQLKIRTRLDQRQYRPGDRAKLHVALTDEAGNPAPGAVSLAAVDEAVFSVGEGSPGMERAFFTLEREMLAPVYAIYPWSPDTTDATPSADRMELEQALFAQAIPRSAGRDAVLQQIVDEYLEGSTEVLDVLNRPDWEDMAVGMGLPDEVISLLRNDGSPHTLSGTTYPSNQEEAVARKRAALERIHVAWVVFFIVVVGGALVYIFSGRDLIAIAVGIVIVGFLIALLLPAVQSAREAARRTQAANTLRELALGIHAAKEAGVDLSPTSNAADSRPVRVRQWFPETLLWRPELITDDNGEASIDIDLADSITSWRLTTSAVSAQGRLGASQTEIEVFQPFFVDLNLPHALTRGDEVSVPIVVYNYLDEPQSVRIAVNDADWFESLDETEQDVELAAGAVNSVTFRLRAKGVGRHSLRITARGETVADAIERVVEVEPDGRRVEEVHNGSLQQPVTIDIFAPDEAAPGSVKAFVKLYPGNFSQLVEGLDGIFARPHGCFEQTSSTTYPNVLALDYLLRTGKSAPQVEAKARQYIHLGYQRLLTFETPGGGFDWFGDRPANRTLTAYGLMEFQDMARVHDVDPRLVSRTRQWLLEQQNAGGSWSPEGHRLHEDPTGGRGDDPARLGATAYIAWAAFNGRPRGGEADAALAYLRSHRPDRIASPYILALVSNALLSIDPSGREARAYLDRLDTIKQTSSDGKLAWWEQQPGGRTTFYGAGRAGDIETSATAALAMLRAKRHPKTAGQVLAWLVSQRDARGAWYSTQGTVLALKALIHGSRASIGDAERRVEIRLDGKPLRTITIPPSEADVVTQVDISDDLTPGPHRVTLTDRAGDAPGYQLAFRYHVTEDSKPEPDPPLSIAVRYGKLELTVGDTIPVDVTVTNNTSAVLPMVVADLPIPAGFRLDGDDLARLVRSRNIAKYEVTPRSVIVYLRRLSPDAPLQLRYQLRAAMPVKVTTQPAAAYEYYNPDTTFSTRPESVTVVAE